MLFTVHAIPVAQPRQRHRSFVAGNGRVITQNYTPQDSPVNAFKATIRQTIGSIIEAGHWKLVGSGPIQCDIEMFFPRPKRLVWKTRPMPRQWYDVKPDIENCIKAILDALTGLAWRDDAQVARLVSEQWYCSGSEPPHVEIGLSLLEAACGNCNEEGKEASACA